MHIIHNKRYDFSHGNMTRTAARSIRIHWLARVWARMAHGHDISQPR